VYTELTEQRIGIYNLRSVTFQHVPLFTSSGDGGDGSWTGTSEYTVGRSQDKTLTSSDTTKIKVGLKAKASYGPVKIEASTEAKYQQGFSSDMQTASKSQNLVKTELSLNLKTENYVY
jgi:hypothetical protein